MGGKSSKTSAAEMIVTKKKAVYEFAESVERSLKDPIVASFASRTRPKMRNRRGDKQKSAVNPQIPRQSLPLISIIEYMIPSQLCDLVAANLLAALRPTNNGI